MTTIGEEKHDNVFVDEETTQTRLRKAYGDHQLPPPKLIKPALEYNLTAHHS